MDGTFDIAVDPDLHLVRIRLAGLFDPDAVARLLAARTIAARRLRCRPNQHLSLTDIRTMNIQTQDIVGAFSAVLADSSFRSRRLGFVVATSLARGQLRRALGSRIGDDVRFFTDAMEAERWVLAGDERSAAA